MAIVKASYNEVPGIYVEGEDVFYPMNALKPASWNGQLGYYAPSLDTFFPFKENASKMTAPEKESQPMPTIADVLRDANSKPGNWRETLRAIVSHPRYRR